MPSFTTSADRHSFTVRTPEVELGFSIDDGGLRVLRRANGPNLLGSGAPKPSLDVQVGRTGAWLADRVFVRYLRHEVEERDQAIELVVVIGIGPLMIYDRYRVTGTLIARRVTVVNVSEDELLLRGVRMVVPWVRIGELDAGRFDAPGNSVRPRVPLRIAAEQRREVLPRRFFAPGLRDSRALEQAPTQSPGLMVVHDPQSQLALLCWYYGEIEPALPQVDGDDEYVSLIHEIALADRLRSEVGLTGGTQYMMLLQEPWPAALAAFRRTHNLSGSRPPADIADWVRDAALYEAHIAQFGGFEGARAALDGLRELGVDTLVMLPIWEFDNQRGGLWDENWDDTGDPYVLRDFEQLDPTLGTPEQLHALVDAAHARGMRVIVDLPLTGCDAGSRYLDEHPDWFCLDFDGQPQIAPDDARLYLFDWANNDLQRYWIEQAVAQARRYGFDGYRAITARYPVANWSERLHHHASAGSLGAFRLLERLRRELRAFKGDAVILQMLGGPLGQTSADFVCDELPHHQFVHMALGRMSPAEQIEWLKDHVGVLPPGVVRVSFVESYRTRLMNPLADGLRGSRLSRMILAGLVFCGFAPILRFGQEECDEGFASRLLGVRARHAALRRGEVRLGQVGSDNQQVFAVTRSDDQENLLCLLAVGPNKRTVTIQVPVELLGLADASYELFDLMRDKPWVEAGQRSWSREGLRSLRMTLEPFEAYCLAIRPAPPEHNLAKQTPDDAEAPAGSAALDDAPDQLVATSVGAAASARRRK